MYYFDVHYGLINQYEGDIGKTGFRCVSGFLLHYFCNRHPFTSNNLLAKDNKANKNSGGFGFVSSIKYYILTKLFFVNERLV